jgi:hypothetical protein
MRLLLACVFLLVFDCSAARAAQHQDGEGAGDLAKCLNANQITFVSYTTWASAMSSGRSRFKVEGVWWSPRRGDLLQAQPLTLLTHLQLDQKWQLKSLCKSWQGPLSAVIHLPTIKDFKWAKGRKKAGAGKQASSAARRALHGAADSSEESTQQQQQQQAPEESPSMDRERQARAEAMISDGKARAFALYKTLEKLPDACQVGEPAIHLTSAGGECQLSCAHESVSQCPRCPWRHTTAGRHNASARVLRQQPDDGLVPGKPAHGEYDNDSLSPTFPGATLFPFPPLSPLSSPLLIPHLPCCPPLHAKNFARLQARTPLVAYVDVDMVVSKTLLHQVQSQVQAHMQAQLQQQGGSEGPGANRTAWVLPAFFVG